MATDRRTISFPPELANRLDSEAAERHMSFSALVVELIGRGKEPPPLRYAGLIEDDEDLSLRVEEILARVLR